jgi:hypothetical protein
VSTSLGGSDEDDLRRRRDAMANAPRRASVDRRAFVVGGLVSGIALVAGCTNDPPHSAPSPRTATEATSTTGRRPRRRQQRLQPLPTSRVWPIRRSEVEPEVKRAAVRLVEALGRWTDGRNGSSAAARRIRELSIAADEPDRLVQQAGPLLGAESEATIRVVTAQYGGLLDESASVLVATRQWRRHTDGGIQSDGVTMDVRLSKRGHEWAVTDLRPSRPDAPTRPAPALIRRVVGHPRIHLPPAAQADVLAGDLCPKGMSALLSLADRYEIDVSVVHSGHPHFVFGTRRLSDHTRKRAFDVWALDGRPIVEPSTPHRLVDGFMRDAVEVGAYNVGGPRPLPGGYFFSDPTHHDHTHIAFDTDT